MALRGVIFDYNGTLLDDLELAYGSVRYIFAQFSLKAPSRETYQLEITSQWLEFYKRHGITLPPHLGTTDGDLENLLNGLRQDFFSVHLPAPFRDGVTALLVFCKQMGLRVGIVSAESGPLLRARFEKEGLYQYFSSVAEDVCVKADCKDKKGALRTMVASWGLEPQQVAYVDDTYQGLMAAREEGLRPVGILGGYGLPEQINKARPDYLLRELLYFLHVLEIENASPKIFKR